MFFLVFLSLVFLNGCVTTNIRSVSNPAFLGQSYDNIIVMVHLSDIGSQQMVENGICYYLNNLGVSAVPSYRVFFQGTSYTPEQQIQVIKQAGYDSILDINFTDSFETQTYVEPTYKTVGSYGTTGFSSTTYQTGGYYVSRPNFLIRTKMIDVNSLGVVWVSDSDSHGCADRLLCTFDRIMDSFADTLVGKLKIDGMLQPKQKANVPDLGPLPSLDQTKK